MLLTLDIITRLHTDLTAYARGDFPSPEALRHAPALHQWKECRRPHPCLTGNIDGRPVRVQRLLLVMPRHGYALTMEGTFALGTPLGANA